MNLRRLIRSSVGRAIGAAAGRFLRSLPTRTYVYSHPAHSRIVLDAQLYAAARRAGGPQEAVH
jgi:hypothetical protein